MYCKKCNGLLNEDNICPICESNTSQKENNELSQAIEELKAGKQEAFNVFYNYTSKYVYSRAKTFSSDEQTANDVMQEVYIAAFKNINSLKSNDSVFAWLRTITFNASSRMMKKNKNEIILTEENEEMLEVLPDESEQIEEDYMNKQDIEIIHICINRLSEEHRIVLLAYYYDNLKVEEIADLLQISSGTVKSRLYNARKKLKEYIEEEENKNGYKLHSFSGLSLALALRKLLQDNMNNSVISNDVLFRSICKKLNTPINNSSITNIAKPKFSNTISGNLKGKIVQNIAETGIKKIVVSTVSTVVAAGIIIGTIIVVTSNSNNVNSKEDSSVITNSETSSIANTEKEEISSEDDKTQNSNNNITSETTQKPKVDTIILHQKTRYMGFCGYFEFGDIAWNAKEADLEKYGIVNTSGSGVFVGPTEYRVDDKTVIRFVGAGIDGIDFCKEMDDNDSHFKTVVKVIDGEGQPPKETVSPSDCATITKNVLTEYLGYKGYFVIDTVSSTAQKGYSSYYTEYYDVKTGENVLFVFEDSNPAYDWDLQLDAKVRKIGLGSIPVNITGEDTMLPCANF